MFRLLSMFLLSLLALPPRAEAVPRIQVTVEVGERASAALHLELKDEGALVVGGHLDTDWTGARRGEVTLPYGTAFDLAVQRVERWAEQALPRSSSPWPDPGPPSPRAFQAPSGLHGLSLQEMDRAVLDTWSGPFCFTLAYELRSGYADPRWGQLGTPEHFRQSLARAWALLPSFLQAHGIPTDRRVDPSSTVHFVAAWTGTLQEPARLEYFNRQLPEPVPGLIGFYTPRVLVPGDSSIVVTPVGGHGDFVLLAHELGHYAWDRFGVRPYWRGTSESFARAFEAWVR